MSTPDEVPSVAPGVESPGVGEFARSGSRPTSARRRAPPSNPDDPQTKIDRLHRGARFHAVLATFFAAGAVVTYLTPTKPDPGDIFHAQAIVHWEVILMALGLAIANLALVITKRRRAAGLALDPDADHPEAKVFE